MKANKTLMNVVTKVQNDAMYDTALSSFNPISVDWVSVRFTQCLNLKRKNET